MNYCTSCGSQLTPYAKFCDNCGVKTDDGRERKGMPSRKGKGRPIFIFIPIIALLLLSAGLTYAMIQGNNPKNIFFQSLNNGFQDVINPFQQIFGENPDLLERIATDAYRNEITISGDADIPGLDQGIALRRSSIGVTTNIDPKKAQGMASLALQTNGANVFQMEVFQSETNTGLKLPYLYDKYLYVENGKFGSFMEELDPYYSGPAQLNNVFARQHDVAGTVFLEPYAKYIMSFLQKEYFTLEKGVTFQGKKFNKVTLTLSGDEVKTLLVDLVDMAADDDELANFISFQSFLTPQEWKQEVKNSLRDLKSNLMEYTLFPNGFRCELIIDGKNNIVHCLTALDVADSYHPDDISNFLFEATNWQDKGKTDSNRKLTISDYYSDLEISWDSVSQADKAQTELVVKSDGEIGPTLKLDTSITGPTRETDFVLHFDDGWDLLHISGAISYTLDQNIKRDYSNQDIHLAANIRVEDYWGDSENASFSLDIKSPR